MIDDFNNFCEFQIMNTLFFFVMIHENQLLLTVIKQMITRDGADDFFFLIDNRIGAESSLGNSLAGPVYRFTSAENNDGGGHDFSDTWTLEDAVSYRDRAERRMQDRHFFFPGHFQSNGIDPIFAAD